MKVAIYSTKDYEKRMFTALGQTQHELHFFTDKLSLQTVALAAGCSAICCFVTDDVNQEVITQCAHQGIQLIALRSAGFDHVNLAAAHANKITVVHVPKYSPQSVAEFAVGLVLTLSRKILHAYQQGLKNNFSLEHLMGFNLYQKTVGIIGTGHIGSAFAQIMRGFGCRILATDPIPNDQCIALGVHYVTFPELLQHADIVSLHCPLNANTHHLLDSAAFAQIKKGAMLINTGRGGLVDTPALIQALDSEQLGYAGLDVYEYERNLFFVDHHGAALQDSLFLNLQQRSNVIITPHQAFLTTESMHNIINTTLDNISAFERMHPINMLESP